MADATLVYLVSIIIIILGIVLLILSRRKQLNGKTLAAIGGVLGAIFVGLAYYMYNYKEVTYTTIGGFQIPSGAKTYPEVVAVFVIFAIIGTDPVSW